MAVKFAKTRKVRVFPKMTGDEKDQIWWTQDDFRSFRKRCWKTLKAEKSPDGTPLKEDQCLRGLEDWSKDKHTERRKRMRDAVLGVILEQECLRSEGRTDEVQISIQYAKLAAESRRIAQLKGAIDAEPLREIVEDSRKQASPDRKRRNPFSVGHDSVEKGSKPSRTHLFTNALRRVVS
jgi:hypothetical protein